MKVILAFFLCTASLFATISYAQELKPSLLTSEFRELKRTGNAEVVSVIDPYTIQLHDGRIIRFSGIDFPDLDIHEAGTFSVLAVDVLKDMLIGKGINIYQTKKKDWGRLTALGHHRAHIEVTEDGKWVQGVLLSLGLARVRTTQRTPELAEEMYRLERTARKENSGIWEIDEFKILSPDTATQRLDSLEIVEGKIKTTALKNNRIFLNFGKDWRDDFTVSIAPKDKRLFSKKGLDPLNWGGKKIRVRGWLRSYNGPYMEVNHPEAIELLTTQTSNALPQ